MANLVDTLGSWSSPRAQRRRVASDLAERALRMIVLISLGVHRGPDLPPGSPHHPG